MREILLDTHIWIWASIEDRSSLSPKALKAIKEAKTKWLSAISCWELAKLVERKRIGFSIPVLNWITRSLNDQIIVATSRVLGMPLVTSDGRILDLANVETIW